jgi:hypothetical protein
MAHYYRDQIAQLREALADEHARSRRGGYHRKLVDKVVLTPVAEDGRKSLTIDLHGHLEGILSLATKAKRPLGESGLLVSIQNWLRGQANGHSFNPLPVRVILTENLLGVRGLGQEAA